MGDWFTDGCCARDVADDARDTMPHAGAPRLQPQAVKRATLGLEYRRRWWLQDACDRATMRPVRHGRESRRHCSGGADAEAEGDAIQCCRFASAGDSSSARSQCGRVYGERSTGQHTSSRRCPVLPAGSCGMWLVTWLALVVTHATVSSAPICSDGVPCVVDKGGASFENSDFLVSAVGCSETVNVKFGSALDATSSPIISMCERNVEGTCVPKSGVILSQFQRECCAKPFVKRSRTCIAPSMADDPNGNFQCIQLSYTMEPGYTTAHVTFFNGYGRDLVNGGQIEACLVASHGNASTTAEPYCILLVVQRCSVCLEPGEGLASVAKRYGSHWTQVYSANPHIKGNPDDLAVGQLVKLGNQYRVKDGDTLVALALKFGVSVNQIFFWNPHLVPLPDLGGKGDRDFLSRLLPIGHELCILPKTCLNSFGDSQPVYNLGDTSDGAGGSWSDPPQVVPTVLDLEDVNYGPGGGFYGSR